MWVLLWVAKYSTKKKGTKPQIMWIFFFIMSMKQNTSVGHLGTQEEPAYVEDVVRTFRFRSFCELR